MDLFPYEQVRPEQDKLVAAVKNACATKGQLIAHAPTGLGKTAAALAPALEHAIENDLLVLFLTSRLTQHALALETVKQISAKHDKEIPVIDIIGKKHLCLQPSVESLKNRDFADYCKTMREDGLCEYYENLTVSGAQAPIVGQTLVQLKGTSAPTQIKAQCAESKLCPYEVMMLLAKGAKVIVTDYSYIFNPRIRNGFFHRIGAELDRCILIVDEGHNLPDRVKELATERITAGTCTRALRELERFKRPDYTSHVTALGEFLRSHVREEEQYLQGKVLADELERRGGAALIEELDEVAQLAREEQRTSSCGALSEFLEAWKGPDDGYARILGRKDGSWQLSYRCLDPAVVTKSVFDEAYASIVMSGTLTPTAMYNEILGLNAEELTLTSPFPDKNRLNLVLPKTTTKYAQRSGQMYEDISIICAQLANAIPGNLAIFFPSYAILESVKETLDTKVSKTVFAERSALSREERGEMLQRFRASKITGAILLGVMGGSFSEGIDLPGNELRGVVIVGLPLGRPDLETKSLIDYFQEKFGKGWEYGYTFPAFNRTLQSAGRCIRTETDKGVIVFLDERYAWENYFRCFPKDWQIRVSLRHERVIEEFFDGH